MPALADILGPGYNKPQPQSGSSGGMGQDGPNDSSRKSFPGGIVPVTDTSSTPSTTAISSSAQPSPQTQSRRYDHQGYLITEPTFERSHSNPNPPTTSSSSVSTDIHNSQRLSLTRSHSDTVHTTDDQGDGPGDDGNNANANDAYTADQLLQLDTDNDGDEGQSRQRTAKACESCRLRRVKCTGDVPCRACRDAGQAAECVVRQKARPNSQNGQNQLPDGPTGSGSGSGAGRTSGPPPRPHPAYPPPLQGYSSKHSPHPHMKASGSGNGIAGGGSSGSSSHLVPGGNETTGISAEQHSSSSSMRSHNSQESLQAQQRNVGQGHGHGYGEINHSSSAGTASTRVDPLAPPPLPTPPLPPPRITPIHQIEAALATWCSYNDETRLSALHASPLPPETEIEAFEDELMRQLIITNDLEQASSLDRLQIVTLYNRYRIFPSALTADQKALVYAALCLAKHAMMKSFVISGTPSTESQTREDVTYFRMACECLARWSFPSVHALWALVCLVPYSQAHGGLSENRELLRMMAWQVRELGLHRTDMGKLYLSGEMSLFPLFRYMDTFLAGLDDLHPFFTLNESDVDLSTFTQLLSPCQQTVSDHAARFHDDFNDPGVDVTADEYVFLAESRWIPSLAVLQSGTETGTPRVKRGWSEIRYYWLRIMLYFQRTNFDPVRANHAWIVVSHCIAQIVYIHHELALIGNLNPSWPQLRRFSICGQLLVLCSARHLYQPRQATELFEKLCFLLEAHRTTWSNAGDLLRGFGMAIVALGFTVSSMSPNSVLNLSLPPRRTNLDPNFTLSDYSFPFDPTLFFAPTGDMEEGMGLAMGLETGPSGTGGEGQDGGVMPAMPLPLPATGLLSVMGQTSNQAIIR